ncbi:MAG TPA: isoaspartyl peptidase/L-asparaginase [Herpetosiphonaceae bacterium]
MALAIAVHGGAGDIPDSLRPEHDQGIRAALEAGKQVLLAGGTALDAVAAAVVVMENLPAFNAGYGSVLNSEGFVEMDAGIMEGETLEIGAVAAITGVRNPIQAARAVLQTPHILFAKDDAERIARGAGLEFVDPETLIAPRRREQWEQGRREVKVDSGADQAGNTADGLADTVGAVALDAAGHVAAATSTGGLSFKPVGRVGDSPLPGGGFYADDQAGACSTTGWGESIARVLMARRAVEGLERGLSPQQAAEAAVAHLGARIPEGEGGLILVGADGEVGAAFNSNRMTHAWWTDRAGEDRVVA